MPPRTRKATQPEPDAPTAACPLCFPAGMPDGSFSVGCEHGTWERGADPAPAPEAPAAETTGDPAQ
jgi:hypothetical protein